MKKIKIILLVSSFAVGFLFLQQIAGQIVVSKSVIANGGATLSDSSYLIVGTLGQPFIGVAQNQTNINNIGFWYLPVRLLSTGVEPSTSTVPKQYRLEQNYPNPFNPSTTIQFALPQDSKVILKLYDILGREVATLVDEELDTGVHKIIFDAIELANGIYIYRIQAEGFDQSKKLILLK